MEEQRRSALYRPLLIAEAANPEWTSVPLVGWNIARAIAKRTDAHLVTHVRNRKAILNAGLVEGADFTAIDNEYMAAPIYRLSDRLRGGDGKGWTTMMAFSSISYYSFEREVWRQFGSRIAAGEFDLVHRITPLSPTNQSPIAKKLARIDVPFVIGPLNGGAPWPKNFRARQYAEKEWLAHIRAAHKLMPFYRATRKHACAIIVGSKHTLSDMPKWAQHKCVLIPENGADESWLVPPIPRSGSTIKAIFIGRLVPYKGADILLRSAQPFLLGERLTIDIVGDGPQRAELEQLAAELGVQSQVNFRGWLKQPEALSLLRASDFMALPSIREFGGGVVVEAMASGTVPVVADYAGPSELVDDQTGIRVAFHDAKSLILGMRQAIERIIDAPDVLLGMGKAAQEKVRRELTWQAKAEQILSVYAMALRSRARVGAIPRSAIPPHLSAREL